MTVNLKKNYIRIQSGIENTVTELQIEQPVSLLAVSKTKPASMIKTLHELGHKDFGENYLQEALAKQAELTDLDIVWHYIGSIQRNKTKDIANHFDWVHTVERDIIAKRLSAQRAKELGYINLCIQVNIDEEETKSGCLPCETIELAEQILQYDNIHLRGLMVIPSKSNSNAFARTKALFDEIDCKLNNPHWDTLSMGMSGDYEDAIKHGATIIRVGSAIFGARN